MKVETQNADLLAVSCPQTGFYMAVDDEGRIFRYNGSAWYQAAAIANAAGYLNSVSCAARSWCMAILGGGDAVEMTGASWSTPDRIDANNDLASISCPRVRFCMAVDASGDAFRFAGSAWCVPKRLDISSNSEASSVSCPTQSFCMAVDSGGQSLTYDGSRWSPPTAIDGSPGGLSFVSCASARHCTVIDNAGDTENWSGTAWTLPRSINAAQSGIYMSLSCAQDNDCVAVGGRGDVVGNRIDPRYSGGGFVQSMEGSAWSSVQTLDAHGGGFTSISCPSPRFCMAVDSAGYALSWQ